MCVVPGKFMMSAIDGAVAVVHHTGSNRFDAGIHRRRREREASAAADTDDADLFAIHIGKRTEIIDAGAEVLRVECGRSRQAWLSATIPMIS